jgi:hypothetical protein
MDTTTMVILVVVGVIVIGAAAKNFVRARTLASASNMAKQLFPVWAAQGPFSSGADSSKAMRGAWMAVFGAEQTEEMEATIRQHEMAYDSDPDEWEKARITALEDTGTDVSDLVTLAEGISAAESLNEELLEGGGQFKN